MKKHKVFELIIDVVFVCVILGFAINLISSEIGGAIKSKFESRFPTLAFLYNYVLIAFALVVIIVYINFKKKAFKRNYIEETIKSDLSINSESNSRKNDSNAVFISMIREGRIGPESLEAILLTLDKASLSKNLKILEQTVPAKVLVKSAAKIYHIALSKKKDKNFQEFRENIQLAAKLSPQNPFYAAEAGRANIILDDIGTAVNYYLAASVQYERQKDLTNLSAVLNNLGFCYHQLGKYEDALNYYQKAYDIVSNGTRTDADEIARYHINVGGSLSNLKRYDNAIIHFTAAQETWIEAGRLGPRQDSHIKRIIGETLNAKAGELHDKKLYNDALTILIKALEIDRANFGSDDEVCGFDLIRIGQAYEGLLEFEKADKSYQEALKILDTKLKNPDHFEIKKILNGRERVIKNLK